MEFLRKKKSCHGTHTYFLIDSMVRILLFGNSDQRNPEDKFYLSA